jgi:hypothetical protein
MSSSSRRRALAVGVAVSLALGAPRPTFAQTDDQKDQAKELFAEGLELRGKGDDGGALTKFKGAYELVKSPITTLEFGRSLMRVGRLVEARAKLTEAADLPQKSTESPQAKEARAEAKKLAAEVATRIPTIKIATEGVPADADAVLSIDGQQVSAAAAATAQSVDPGKHRVAAKLSNGVERHEDVDLREGEAKQVVLSFGAKTAVAEGPSSGPSTVTLVAFGVAGAGLLVGTVTGLIAKGKASDLSNSPACRDSKCGPSEHDAVDSYNRTAAISTVSFVIGGIAAGVGVVTLLTGRSNEAEPRPARITPWVGWGTAGIGGAF